MKMLRLAAAAVLTWLTGALAAQAADPLNVYTIWPENYARPMFQEFEKATGIKVNFLRFSSGEALARVIAEKNNPRVDVLFGGPVETFAAGIKDGVFEPYKPATYDKLPARFKDKDGYWVAIADDPLVFMTNNKFLKDANLKPPASWNDLLDPAYKGQLQMADAAPAIFLYASRYEYAVSQRVHGVHMNNVIEPADRFQYVTQWYVNTGG